MAKTAKSANSASRNCWEVLADVINSKVFPQTLHRVLLYGPPGTGKSRWIEALTSHYERITLYPSQFLESLVGTRDLQNGSTVWTDGPLPSAMRKGIPLVLDEFDSFSPDIRTGLHAALDDISQCRLTLPTGETVEPKPGYCVVATTNVDPSTLPEPLRDRFDLIINCGSPAPGLLKSLTNTQMRNMIENHYVRQFEQNPFYTPAQPLTARSAIRASRLLEAGLTEDAAMPLVFGNHAETVTATMKTA